MRTLLLMLSLLSFTSFARAEETKLEDGFIALFDGKSLDGWHGDTKGYAVKDGAIVCEKGKGGNLYTNDEFANFEFRFQFKLTPGANNGIAVRAPDSGDAAYQGMEIQVLDDTAEQYAKLKPYQYHGSVYGVVAAKQGHLKPVGEWNDETIVCDGKHIQVILNGEKIVDADLEAASTPKTIDGNNHPGLKREKGYLGFCGHGAHVEFRNLRIKQLK